MSLSRRKELLRVALELLETGIQPVAVSEIRICQDGKKDFYTITKWKDRNESFTKEEIIKDFNNSRTKNIAIRTDDPFVIDQDNGADEQFVSKYLEPIEDTVIVETPDSGRHYWFTKNGLSVKNSTSFLAKNIDVKGEGGIALIPPSEVILLDGTIKPYKWICDFRNSEIAKLSPDLERILQSNSIAKTNWNEYFEKENPEGTRTIAATKVIGKLLKGVPEALWKVEIWNKVKQWNENKNKPPLETDELRLVFESIAKRETTQRLVDKIDDKHKSHADILLELIDNNNNFQFFHDEQKNPFVRVEIEEHYEIWRVSSQDFNLYLTGLFYKTEGKPVSPETLKNVLNVLCARAIFDGEMYKLHNRIAMINNEILYDLSNKEWQGMKISENGVEIVDQLPIAFKRYPHQLPQPLPFSGVDLINYLKFFNLKNSDFKVLLLVWIVTCFIPDIPHTILYLHGIQGSAKSTIMRLLKQLIDNSSVDLLTLVSDKAELAQILSHHWLSPFDNVSDISNEVSDTLCRAASGYSFSKRKLYSDEDDVIFSIKRPIALNGINMVFTRADLLERSLLIELEPIPPTKRRTEQEILEQFEAEKPSFLGSIFDTLSEAMKIKKSIKLSSKARMADFVEWGCAIAIAIGYTKDDFLNAYELNLKLHTEEVINSSLPAQMIIKFMVGRSEWLGTAENLYNELTHLLDREGIKPNRFTWISSPNSLGRLLNRLKPSLEHFGIYIDKQYKGRERLILLTRKPIVAFVAD